MCQYVTCPEPVPCLPDGFVVFPTAVEQRAFALLPTLSFSFNLLQFLAFTLRRCLWVLRSLTLLAGSLLTMHVTRATRVSMQTYQHPYRDSCCSCPSAGTVRWRATCWDACIRAALRCLPANVADRSRSFGVSPLLSRCFPMVICVGSRCVYTYVLACASLPSRLCACVCLYYRSFSTCNGPSEGVNVNVPWLALSVSFCFSSPARSLCLCVCTGDLALPLSMCPPLAR